MSQSPGPDASWRGLPSWLIFAFFVIGPPAAFVAFARTLTQNPVLLALLVAGYEIVLFVFRFTGKVWQQLEDTLTTHIAQWLTARVQEETSRYYQHYCQYLVHENEVFDVKGLSTRSAHDLELEQVFVDLRIHPMPPHRAPANPLGLPESLQGTHSIWDYLTNTTLSNPHLVILGVPGSGKTTLLRYLALTLAQPKKYPRRRSMRHTFPILLFLRDHARSIIEQSGYSLAQAVQDHMQYTWQQTIPATWIGRWLARGRCLVLLDGLDEVADSTTRKLVVAWVQRQLIGYGDNRFVLTSRPYGYRENPLDGVSVLDVQAFTPEQVEQFVHNWYLASELKSWGKDDPGVHRRAREGTSDLLRRLRQAPALIALAINPLLLTMIATVHRYRSSLPGKRVDLYAEICEVFLGKRQEARGIAQDLSPVQKQQVLQPLAYHLMQQGTREIAREEAQQVIAPVLALVSAQMQPADFLQSIENTSGLLLERNPGIYGFAHLTFQEYLAATHITKKGLEQLLMAQVADSWWHETIRLYCAQADSTALILACLADNPPTVAALTLAFECDQEKLMIQPHAQEQLNMLLETGVEDSDPERRRVIAEALLERRARHMEHLHQETYIDTSLITCAEYQVFLDDQRTQCRYYQPAHWTGISFPAGSGRTPILGIRQSDAQEFCKWLSARDKEGWRYRLPHNEERLPQKEGIQGLLSAETGYWLEEERGFAWSQGRPSDDLHQKFIDCIDRIRERGRAIAIDLVLDLAIDLARDREGAIDFARVRDLDLARVREGASTIDLDLAIDLAIDRARDRKGAIAIDLDRIYDLARDLDRVRYLSRDRRRGGGHGRGRNRDIARALDRVRDLDSVRARYRTRDFAEALESARNLAIDLDLDRAVDRVLYFDNTITLYITISLLQERIARRFPAYEGILLVMEREELGPELRKLS